MIKIAICDDEKSVCAELEKLLLKIGQTIFEQIEIDVFFSGEELYNYMSNKNHFDIIFLDIELGILNGVDVGTKIRNELSDDNIQIIYISSKESYAMQLFKIRPLDFIIKPVTYKKILVVLRIALTLIKKNGIFFDYSVSYETHKLPIKDIMYFESNKRKINIITSTEIKSFYGNLNSTYEKVKQFNFMYIHKSYLVNYDYVTTFEYDKLTLINNKVLPISQANRKQIREMNLQILKKES
jgi:DNA-binding LytR/AlgR family response regulator